MKAKKWFQVLLLALAALLVFGGCEWLKDDDEHEGKDASGAHAYCTASFVVVGGPLPPHDQTVKFGERITEPVVRDISGNVYTVVWYTDQIFTMPYSFSAPVITDTVLYGKWQEDGQFGG